MAGEPRSASVKTKSVVPLIATWLNCAVHRAPVFREPTAKPPRTVSPITIVCDEPICIQSTPFRL